MSSEPDNLQSTQPDPIDCVITWVDGNDPAHQERLNSYLASQGKERPVAARSTRFADNGELEFCVVSILRFAPWVRRIYILTDKQTPSFMKKVREHGLGNKIRIIDHSIIFQGYEQYLPTFNSQSITNLMWRIPDLSEQFLFLNDDFLFTRMVRSNDFFSGGRSVLRGHWSLQARLRPDKIIRNFVKYLRFACFGKSMPYRFSHMLAQEQSARLAGFRCFRFELPHTPHPLHRSTFKHFDVLHPGKSEKNISFRLRSMKQFEPVSMMTCLDILSGQYEIREDCKTLMIKPEKLSGKALEQRLNLLCNDHLYASCCIQSLDRAEPEVRDKVTETLTRHIGTLEDFLKAGC